MNNIQKWFLREANDLVELGYLVRDFLGLVILVLACIGWGYIIHDALMMLLR